MHLDADFFSVMPEASRKIWNADFVVDTNVINWALDLDYLRRLVDLLQRMTARPEYGKGWFALTTLVELLQTSDARKRTLLLETLLRVYDRLHGRVQFLAPLQLIIEGEWEDPRKTPTARVAQLEPDIRRAISQGTLDGTNLEHFRVEYLGWKNNQRSNYQSSIDRWRAKYRADSGFRESVNNALKNMRAPMGFGFCDDIVQSLVAGLPESTPDALAKAIANPDRYQSTWSFAVLVRFAQFAQTIPEDVRENQFKEYGVLLKPDRNDIADATIAAVGASCGIMLTEDSTLRDRLNLLHDRGLTRLQGFSMDYLARNWHPPNGHRD